MDLNYLIAERNLRYRKTIEMHADAVCSIPVPPAIIKPSYSGSLIVASADYYAKKINEENQEKYKALLKRFYDNIHERNLCRKKCRAKEYEILKNLGKIPNSDSYVKILKEYFDEDDKKFDEADKMIKMKRFGKMLIKY